jgi:hypothetical protein
MLGNALGVLPSSDVAQLSEQAFDALLKFAKNPPSNLVAAIDQRAQALDRKSVV